VIWDESKLCAFGTVHFKGDVLTESDVMALSALTFLIAARHLADEGGAGNQEQAHGERQKSHQPRHDCDGSARFHAGH
jgi:hypothetical protein